MNFLEVSTNPQGCLGLEMPGALTRAHAPRGELVVHVSPTRAHVVADPSLVVLVRIGSSVFQEGRVRIVWKWQQDRKDT